MAKLLLVIGYGGRQVDQLRRVCGELSQELGITCYVYFVGELEREPVKSKLSDLIREVDLVFLYSYTLPDFFIELLQREAHRVKIVSIDVHVLDLSNVDLEIVKRAREYFIRGGEENLRRLVKYLASLCGVATSIEPPLDVPWDGIYHPDHGLYTDLEQYLSTYRYADRPLVGLLFYRSLWLSGDIEPVVELVRALEEEGLGVIPVFTYGHRDDLLGIPSKAETCRKYFFKNGMPVIDFLIDFTSFFFTTRRFAAESFQEEVSELDLLVKLGVPVMRPILMWHRTVEEWLESSQGVDYLTQLYQVIMPEVDGLIEPIVLAGTVRDGVGMMRRSVAVREHARYIARRVKRWVELRRKKPSERRVAIILHNAPCKGLEANIAVGLGLDVLESVVRLLHRLREHGYVVENIPKSGQELAKLFLEKRAVSDFRWTSVQDVVERGGVLDFVDMDTYLSWFNELPEDVREKMIRDWGHPSQLREGGSFAGMIYNGKFVIPGLRFGNIVVLLQPKFGCAGPRCDGRVCKILHDPTVTPPHQWLAVYRWITRVFKADVVIHFGTHGYLEFRPGKGVGLSWKCWPEISIDDVPHLYVYVVTNPMEGVIAKRRGYATLVDHLYPPMTVPDVLEEIDMLIAQYLKAKSLGEAKLCESICDKLRRLSLEHNIPVRATTCDELVEELHRYVDMVRSTQINRGLHVIGRDYSPDEIAEYVSTLLLKDTARYRSVVHIVFDLLGLDYNKYKSGKVEILPDLGVAANEIARLVRESLREVLQLALREDCKLSGEELAKLLLERLCEKLNIELVFE